MINYSNNNNLFQEHHLILTKVSGKKSMNLEKSKEGYKERFDLRQGKDTK